MAIFAEFTENERIIDRHPRYTSTSRLWRLWKSVYDLDLIEIGLSALYGFSVRPWFQYYAAVARSLCDS